MNLHVVTRATRLSNLKDLHKSFNGNDLNWHVVIDTSVVKSIDTDLLQWLSTVANVIFKPGDGWGLSNLNDILRSLPSGYVFNLDDDNIMHPDYYTQIKSSVEQFPDKKVFCYGQQLGLYTDTVRNASPESTVVGGIDLAQYTVHTDVYKEMSYGSGYTADGEFIEAYHKAHPDQFVFIKEFLCYYNFLADISVKKTSAPNVLYIGEDKPELKSLSHLGYEDTSLNVSYITVDDLSWENIDFSEYDSIISKGNEDWSSIPLLPVESYDVRNRWFHSNDKIENPGELAYNVAMNSILKSYKPKISFFTPAYKTPLDRIQRLYDSLGRQTFSDWEWVIVNDSPQDKKLSDRLEMISKVDSRVKVFTFEKPSGGVIGEVKYRAASMCRGDILAEVDHDDELLPLCAQYLIDASEAHPECGFFYTNCVEVDEKYTCLKYPDGFAFGYGSYRKTFDKSVSWEYEESICVGINPKTIRHIVGVPNHIRAWRRDVYNKIGGHNRRLTIADDYELIVRTFLITKFCHIDACGYIQFIYNNETGQNTHDATRGDIQRRVRSIANYYNHDIANRFFYLGVKDWAYEESPNNPLMANSRFGEKENRVNVVFTPKS